MELTKLQLAMFYHEIAQKTVVDGLKLYLQAATELLRQPGNPTRMKVMRTNITNEIIHVAKFVEDELEMINAELISEFENGRMSK